MAFQKFTGDLWYRDCTVAATAAAAAAAAVVSAVSHLCPDWRKVFIDFLTGLLYTVVRRVCAPQIGPAGRLAWLLVGGTFI